MHPHYDSAGRLRTDVPYFRGFERPGFLADTKPGDVIFFRMGGGVYSDPFRVVACIDGVVTCVSYLENKARDFSPHEAVRIQRPMPAQKTESAAA